jgi:hypothetical protein
MGREEAAYTVIFPATLPIAACPIAGRTRSGDGLSIVLLDYRGWPLQDPQSAPRG